LSEFPKALAATARAADQAAAPIALLQGRPIKPADGAILTVPDTPKNRKAYPPLPCPEPNFPLLRILVLFSLLSGAILSVVSANLHTAELPMLAQLMGQLARGDIQLGDRGFGNFVTWRCCRTSTGALTSSAVRHAESMAVGASNGWVKMTG